MVNIFRRPCHFCSPKIKDHNLSFTVQYISRLQHMHASDQSHIGPYPYMDVSLNINYLHVKLKRKDIRRQYKVEENKMKIEDGCTLPMCN